MKRQTCSTLFFLLCFAIFFPQLSSFCKKQTDGFSIGSIQSSRKREPQWDTRTLSLQETASVQKVLTQPFHYLSSGQQSFVFLSEDGQYVIKFFKQNIYDPSWRERWMPTFLHKKKQKAIDKKRNKLERDFTSYRLAFEEMQEETGLLLVHLNPTDSFHQKLTIIDKLHISHKLDIDSTSFILQKRAELVCPRLTRLMEAGKIEEAKQTISSLFDLLEARYKKEIFDSDPDFDKNFGFLENTPVQIDIGRFNKKTFVPSSQIHENATYITNRRKRNKTKYYSRKEDIPCLNPKFPNWLKAHYPDLALFLDEEMKRRTESHAFIYP